MNTDIENIDKVLPLKDEVYEITGAAMSVLNNLGHGFAEKVYENALAVELESKGIFYKQQPHFDVVYKNVHVGHYIPDMIVDNQVVVEMKTIEKISASEIGQILNYLKVTGLKVGLILNFKHSKLEWKRVVL